MIVAADGTLVGTHMGEIMQSHLDHIVEVMQNLENGELDLASARSALREL
jgi:hypothetical protein